MKNKHTPEPWIQDGTWVVDNDNNIIHRGQNSNNARLIAAAPELLEALEDALDELNAINEATHGIMSMPTPLIDKIYDVIAKAKGK